MQLAIPKPNTSGESNFPDSVRKLKKWIAEAEKLETGARIKQFYQLLIQMNRGEIAAKERIEMMDMLRPMFCSSVEYLEKRYVNVALPLSENAQNIFKLSLTINDEMASGYKIPIQQLIDKKIKMGFSSGWVVHAIERSIYYVSLTVLRYAQVFTKLHAPSWADLNILYQYAEQQKFIDKKVKDEEHPNDKVTVNLLYKSIALFTLSNPYSLRKGEAKKVYKNLHIWAPLVTIEKDKPSEAKNYFALDIANHMEPGAEDFVDDFHTGTTRFIILDKLIDHLQKQIEKRAGTEADLIQDEELNVVALRRLVKNWHKRNTLRPKRKLKPAKVTVEIGIQPIAYHMLEDLLASDDPFAEEPPEDEQLGLDGMPVSNEENNYLNHPSFHDDKENKETVWDQIARGNELSPKYEHELAEYKKENLKQKSRQADHEWLLQNISAGGYSLKWNGTSSPHAHVGEVVGLREASPSSPWHVTVIRWIQYHSEKEFVIGVQALSNKGRFCDVSRTTGDAKLDEQKQKCLVLPPIKKVHQPLTLVAPAYMFHVNEVLNVEFNTEEFHLKLEEIYEHSGSFTQFVAVPEVVKDESKKVLTEEKSTQYDSVFKSL